MQGEGSWGVGMLRGLSWRETMLGGCGSGCEYGLNDGLDKE